MKTVMWLAAVLFAAPWCAAEFTLAAFSAEVIPPMGHACMAGGIPPARAVSDPLWCHGVVLSGGGAPVVLAAIDWCEIRNDAYDRWRQALAEAAGTLPSRVLFASVHQHDAPVADLTAQRLLDAQGLENALCDPVFHEEAVQRVAAALREALDRAVPVTHYGIGRAEVRELASNRRIETEEGSVHFGRTSATPDPGMRAAPVGLHDPMLKTLSFWNDDLPLAAMHFYAVHPMSFYGRGVVSADFAGAARQLRLAADPSVHQIYFSGCSGDLVAGKWNDGDPLNRLTLAGKIYEAMAAAWEATERHPLEAIGLRVATLELPLKTGPGYTEEDLHAVLRDAEQKTFERILAAMGLSWRKRVLSGQPIEVPALHLGKAQVLLLPAEAFVGYQIMAQEMRPDQAVHVIGYGECAPGYIPTESASVEGFNEHHDWCWVDPGAEAPMRQAIADALDAAE